jgi:hypothetical protein
LVAYTNSHPIQAVKSYRSTLRAATRKSLPVNQPDRPSAAKPLVLVLLSHQALFRIQQIVAVVPSGPPQEQTAGTNNRPETFHLTRSLGGCRIP